MKARTSHLGYIRNYWNFVLVSEFDQRPSNLLIGFNGFSSYDVDVRT